ncbi:glycosyltransferase [Gammaproteobacteria bacterium]|nr:glycosyltransferase [Gammaproteobacteria bacterium]
MVKISVITPSFNQDKYIERTIQSVLSQNINDFEYIVMDGASSDKTVSILKSYSSYLKFISEPDNGQAHAVNKGIKMSSGEIIAWINSDDIYYPNTFKKVIKFFDENPNVDILYGNANHINATDHFIDSYPSESFSLKKLKETCYFCQPAVFFRKKCISTYGMLNESLNFCMDYDLWLRFALQGASFAYLPDIFSGSRLYPETKTIGSPVAATKEAVFMLKKNLNYVPTRWLYNYASCSIQNNNSINVINFKFYIKVYVKFIKESFLKNGFFRGLMNIFVLPIIKINHILRNKI